MNKQKDALTNHQITIYLKNGTIMGPFKATWDKDTVSDVRELTKEYDDFLEGKPQKRYRYHLHDLAKKVSNTVILSFSEVCAIYDHVDLL